MKAGGGEKGPLQLHCSLAHSRVALFTCPNRRACWQANEKLPNECELDVLSTKCIACMGTTKKGILYEGCSKLCC